MSAIYEYHLWWDFKKHVVDGKTYYSYHDQTGTYDGYGLDGFAPGERVILDENFNEIKRITFEPSDVVDISTKISASVICFYDIIYPCSGSI